MAVDATTYKEFFANWPAAVVVITCRGTDGEPKGFTASSFGPLSLDPPLVMFALYRKAGSFPHFEAAEGFGVSALRADQADISDRFASPHPDRFASLRYRTGETGAPLLEDAWGRIECRMKARYDGGDHVLFVGEVLSMDMEGLDEATEPLVYHRRGYRRLAGG